MRLAKRLRVYVLELECLRSMVGVTSTVNVGNEEIGMGSELVSRVCPRVLLWFGHMGRIVEQRMAIIVMRSTGSGEPSLDRLKF